MSPFNSRSLWVLPAAVALTFGAGLTEARAAFSAKSPIPASLGNRGPDAAGSQAVISQPAVGRELVAMPNPAAAGPVLWMIPVDHFYVPDTAQPAAALAAGSDAGAYQKGIETPPAERRPGPIARALSRLPRRWMLPVDGFEAPPRFDGDAVVVLDPSGSIDEPLGKPSPRLDAAKEAVEAHLQHERLSGTSMASPVGKPTWRQRLRHPFFLRDPK